METSFGDKIRKLREDQKLLLRELSAKLEIDPALLSKIERNHRTAKRELVEKMSKVLNVKLDDLMISWISDKILGLVKVPKTII